MDKLAEGRQFQTDNATEFVIEGGNHAQFGNCGEQSGDLKAEISAEEQQNEAIKIISEIISQE